MVIGTTPAWCLGRPLHDGWSRRRHVRGRLGKCVVPLHQQLPESSPHSGWIRRPRRFILCLFSALCCRGSLHYPPCITHAALVACEALHRPPCIIHAALAACASLLWLAGVLDTAAAALHSVPFLCSPLPRFSALSPCITHAALVACEALHRPPCIIHAALVACEAIAPVASQKSYLQRCPQSCIV